jgi:hypothetical protein
MKLLVFVRVADSVEELDVLLGRGEYALRTRRRSTPAS